MKKIPIIVASLIISISAGIFISEKPTDAKVEGWTPGYIISDSVFSNSKSMDVASIQNFLNSKVPNCDTYGQQLSEFGGPDLNGDGQVQRWEWGKQNYNQTTFPCLKEYTQDGISAAQLIYNASQTYSINPQVMLVLLQKEQGLITDTWPLNIQYRSATGYGCPDTAACDSKYYGLNNQLKWAATMFRAILDDSPTWYTPYLVGNNYIRYNPQASCGGSDVYIQNRSTQALYNYTPYQPNQGALDADWGTAPCGAYGNRNFHLYFNSWFGSIKEIVWQPLQDSRLMLVVRDTRKKDPSNLMFVDSIIPQNTIAKFTTKTTVNGADCLRTAHDTFYGNSRCILVNDLGEITINYELLPDNEKIKNIKSSRFKNDLRRSASQTTNLLFSHRQIEFSAKTTVNGIAYYVTKHDYTYGNELGIPLNELLPSSPYEAIQPDWAQLKTSTRKILPDSGINVDDTLASRSTIQFASRKQVNSVWYYRTQKDTNDGVDKAISENNIDFEAFSSFLYPRWMSTAKNTFFVNPFDGTELGAITPDTQYRFTSKVNVNGINFFRIASDATTSTDRAIHASDVQEINYESFKFPRSLKLTSNTNKYIPAQGIQVDDTLDAGMTIKFATKITVGDKIYYRTEHDTLYGNNKGIDSTLLQELN